MNWTEIIAGALSGGAVVTAINEWSQRKKTKSEAVTIAMDGTVRWAESMRKDVEALRADLDALRDKYIKLVEENKMLHIEVAGLRAELSQYRKG